jgi:hypothetical protein
VKLLLITGAGASRELAHEGDQMPLMADWSDALCESLDAEEQNLARACHLQPGMSAEEFETNLGLLLRWNQVRGLAERFRDLGGTRAGSHTNHAETARKKIDERMGVVMTAVNRTLFDQFGQQRIDKARAAEAYRGLLTALGNPELVVSTTNYDRAAEEALEACGHAIHTGFPPSGVRTPRLEPAGMVVGKGSATPVIHLHGAVGWYEREGTVEDHYGDQPYNPTLGTPTVLYPDPEKDPTSHDLVRLLWNELSAAVDWAQAVLVLGHSLHDAALTRQLNAVAREKPVRIGCHSAADLERAEAEVPDAQAVEFTFGPGVDHGDDLVARLRLGPEYLGD